MITNKRSKGRQTKHSDLQLKDETENDNRIEMQEANSSKHQINKRMRDFHKIGLLIYSNGKTILLFEWWDIISEVFAWFSNLLSFYCILLLAFSAFLFVCDDFNANALMWIVECSVIELQVCLYFDFILVSWVRVGDLHCHSIPICFWFDHIFSAHAPLVWFCAHTKGRWRQWRIDHHLLQSRCCTSTWLSDIHDARLSFCENASNVCTEGISSAHVSMHSWFAFHSLSSQCVWVHNAVFVGALGAMFIHLSAAKLTKNIWPGSLASFGFVFFWRLVLNHLKRIGLHFHHSLALFCTRGSVWIEQLFAWSWLSFILSVRPHIFMNTGKKKRRQNYKKKRRAKWEGQRLMWRVQKATALPLPQLLHCFCVFVETVLVSRSCGLFSTFGCILCVVWPWPISIQQVWYRHNAIGFGQIPYENMRV